MVTRNVAAVDLGAESGRVILARFDGQQLDLQVVHRFPNRPSLLHGHRFWDMQGLWDETLIGLRKARQTAGSLDSIGVDTWGVDYGLVDSQGLLSGNPYQYRDHRTDGMMEQVFARVPRDVLYKRTGIQFLPFNTLFQLYAHEQMQPGELARTHRLLLIPDLLHGWLCGSQVSNDLGAARVIAPATHDTGSAIAATPAQLPGGWGYISSGTWSLVGVELQQPLMSPEALAANCTNEGGVFGTTRFLKNVMGLWLLQECQRSFARGGHFIDYDTLLANVEANPTFAALIDPDDPRFLAPEDMPDAINTYLHEHQQAPLADPAAFARCIMESLVLRYRKVFQQIKRLTGTVINVVHTLGGGARNALLNQWLADALDVAVIAGPFEATAQGNALMQLVGLGELHTLEEVRAIAQRAPTRTFLPNSARHPAWNEAGQRFGAEAR